MTGRIDRRGFLGALPGVALAARTLRVGPRRRRDGLGLQLYTVRNAMAESVGGTLATVAGFGYREVEFAGLFGLEPREMRSILEDVELRAASSHASVGDVRGDWAGFLEGARELGQALVVVPSVPGDERSPEGLRRLADDFNRAGEAARAMGLRFGYHNHDWEMRPFADGVRPMDVLLERTDAALVDWQMDVFWTVHGGADPRRYLRDVGERVTSVHVKDRTVDGRMVDVGDGVIDYSSLLPLAESEGLLHAFVEHDTPSLESARRSFEHLEGLGLAR